MDLVNDMKQRARAWHRSAQRGEADAIVRLRVVEELRGLEDAELAERAQRRHALAALASALGFRGWPHARAVLAGEPRDDRGELMHRNPGGAYWNIWSASYDEAEAIRRDHGGILLAYRRQFLIVEPPYIEHLGLEPDDPDWDRMGRDWVRPADRAAWTRITRAAIEARLARAA